MGRSAKIRFGAYLLVLVWLGYCAAAYALEFIEVTAPRSGFGFGKIFIDGSDFTKLFELLSFGADGMINTVVLAVYLVLMLGWSLFCFLILRLASIRKTTEVTQQECRLTNIAFAIALVLTFIITFLLIGSLLGALLFVLPIPLFWLIYALGLKFHRFDENEI